MKKYKGPFSLFSCREIYNKLHMASEQIMISHTHRLIGKNSEVSPFFESVTSSHKTQMLSGKTTTSTIMGSPTFHNVAPSILTLGRINEEFITVSMVCVTKLLRRKNGAYRKRSDKDIYVRVIIITPEILTLKILCVSVLI